MRIAVVTSGYLPVPASLGGAVETLANGLIKENERQGTCELVVFSCYEEKAEEMARLLKHTKVEFIKTPGFFQAIDWVIYHTVKCVCPRVKAISFRYIFKRLYFIEKVAQKLHEENYDRVMIENHASLLLTLKKYHNYKKYAGRFFYHVHNEQRNLYGCGQVLLEVRKVAAISQYIAGHIKEKLPGLRDDQVTVWRNCVDVEYFREKRLKTDVLQLKKELGLSDTDAVVLFVGRLTPEKGVKELLMAFEKIKHKEARLVITGEYFFADKKVSSFYEAELRPLVQRLGDKVILTGYIDYQKMPLVYQMADIVVLPSQWNEPAGLTVIEALSCGRPLITTHSGGIPEYANEECAVLLERDAQLIDRMAAAMNELLLDRPRRDAMAQKARAVSKDWTIQKYFDRFLEVVELDGTPDSK